jgi:hypothetical protein
VATATFCLRREYLLAHPFPARDVGFGTRWLWGPAAPRVGTVATPFYVATIHPGNVAAKDTAHEWWRPVPPRDIARLVGDDWPLP